MHEGPGLRVHPPVIYLAVLLIGVGLNHWWSIRPLPGPWGAIVGVTLLVMGVAIMPSVLARFRRADTPFNAHKPTTVLIVDGPYRFSRNPAYVALTLWYLGIGFLLNNAWILLSAIPVVLMMDQWVIPREEHHLEARFGEQYLHYKSQVRRWL